MREQSYIDQGPVSSKPPIAPPEDRFEKKKKNTYRAREESTSMLFFGCLILS